MICAPQVRADQERADLGAVEWTADGQPALTRFVATFKPTDIDQPLWTPSRWKLTADTPTAFPERLDLCERPTRYPRRSLLEDEIQATTGAVVSMVPSAERAGELIVHRPHTMTPARRVGSTSTSMTNRSRTWRSVHGERTDRRGPAPAPAVASAHQRRASFVLADYETLRVLIYVGALEELEIHLDENHDPDHSSPPSA